MHFAVFLARALLSDYLAGRSAGLQVRMGLRTLSRTATRKPGRLLETASPVVYWHLGHEQVERAFSLAYHRIEWTSDPHFVGSLPIPTLPRDQESAANATG